MAAVLAEVDGVDAAGFADEEKPAWEDDIDIGDIVPEKENVAGPSTLNNRERKKEKKKEKKRKRKEAEVEVDAEEFDGVDVDAMDADAPEPELDEEDWDGTEEMRKRVLDKYVEQLYGLEFNDMVCSLSYIDCAESKQFRRLEICRHASNTPPSGRQPMGSHPSRSSWLRIGT